MALRILFVICSQLEGSFFSPNARARDGGSDALNALTQRGSLGLPYLGYALVRLLVGGRLPLNG